MNRLRKLTPKKRLILDNFSESERTSEKSTDDEEDQQIDYSESESERSESESEQSESESERSEQSERKPLIKPAKDSEATKNSKNTQLSKEEESTIIDKFTKEGYVITKSFNKNLIGKKVRYILKNGKVRLGGVVVSLKKPDKTETEENEVDGDGYLFIKPFKKTNSVFDKGWSVQRNDIKLLFVGDVKRPKKSKQTTEQSVKLPDEEKIKIINEIKTENDLKNKTAFYNYYRDNIASTVKKSQKLTRAEINRLWPNN